MFIIAVKSNSSVGMIAKAKGVKMTAKVVGKNSSLWFSLKNTLYAVMQQSTSAKFWSFFFLSMLLNRFLLFLLLSMNENLLLLTFLSHFFHFILCIWELQVLKVNSFSAWPRWFVYFKLSLSLFASFNCFLECYSATTELPRKELDTTNLT